MQKEPFQKPVWDHRFSHGGRLRQLRRGRGARPLSLKQPIHLVFKANRSRLGSGFRSAKRFTLIHSILKLYAARFFVKIEAMSVQGDHIHIIVRLARRSSFQNFMRVISGQIAQKFALAGLLVTDTQRGACARVKKSRQEQSKLWKHRPFTRVVIGWRSITRLTAYVRLNELEALGKIPYRKSRTSGLRGEEWLLLNGLDARRTIWRNW